MSLTVNPDQDDPLGFTTRVLVPALFPYRRQQELTRTAHYGHLWRITITSPNGIPYGRYPRLILAYLVTQAVQRPEPGPPTRRAGSPWAALSTSSSPPWEFPCAPTAEPAETSALSGNSSSESPP